MSASVDLMDAEEERPPLPDETTLVYRTRDVGPSDTDGPQQVVIRRDASTGDYIDVTVDGKLAVVYTFIDVGDVS